jgi:hypothetical protein
MQDIGYLGTFQQYLKSKKIFLLSEYQTLRMRSLAT